MPIYEYECPRGHKHQDMFAWDKRPDAKRCIHQGCNQKARIVVSQVQRAALAPHFSREAEDINARNRAWLESDEAKVMMKNDELVPEDNPRSDEAVVGAIEASGGYAGSDINTGLAHAQRAAEDADIHCEERWAKMKSEGAESQTFTDNPDGIDSDAGLGGDGYELELEGLGRFR